MFALPRSSSMFSYHRHHFGILAVISLTCQIGCGGGYESRIETLEGKTTIQIDLSNTQITDADLLALELPSSLQAISLENTAITDAGVDALLGAKNLEQVNLGNTKITPACMEILEQLPNLQSVNVAGENINQAMAFDFYQKIVAKNPAGSMGNKASVKFFKPSE